MTTRVAWFSDMRPSQFAFGDAAGRFVRCTRPASSTLTVLRFSAPLTAMMIHTGNQKPK